jgi:hypothetical protein
MLSDTKPRGILPFRYRGFRLDRYLYFIVATESQPLVVCVLGAYPAYSSPIPIMYRSRASRRAALARQRPLEAWTALDKGQGDRIRNC